MRNYHAGYQKEQCRDGQNLACTSWRVEGRWVGAILTCAAIRGDAEVLQITVEFIGVAELMILFPCC